MAVFLNGQKVFQWKIYNHKLLPRYLTMDISRFGAADILVTDKGRQFTWTSFKDFCSLNTRWQHNTILSQMVSIIQKLNRYSWISASYRNSMIFLKITICTGEFFIDKKATETTNGSFPNLRKQIFLKGVPNISIFQ